MQLTINLKNGSHMNTTIEDFLSSKEIAVAGVSPKKGNWGMTLVKELKKKGYKVYPVNPKYQEIGELKVWPTVKELPETVESLILAVNPELAKEIIAQSAGTGIKRAWMQQSMGDGAYSPEGVELAKENNIDVVHGFCPMMFFGGGMHKFHLWMRKNFGKTPAEYAK